jgi:periplasmic protein TonB
MQPEQIMSSDLLDILFADRNKMYGAYTLRKEYNHRLKKALMMTGALVCTALALYYYLGEPQTDVVKKIFVDLPPSIPAAVPKAPKPPAPLAPRPKQQQISTRRFIAPVIVKDDMKHDPPPPIDEMINSRVGLEHKTGIPDGGFPPPAVDANGVTPEAAAVTTEISDVIVDKVDIESSYPGGPKAWKRFLIKTFRYPHRS